MNAPGAVPPFRSLVVRTVALVLGVVLAIGAAVVLWITAEDRRESEAEASRLEGLAEQELFALSADLVREHQDIAKALVERSESHTRDWLEAEPLGLYRDRAHPERVDVDALRRALTAEVRTRGQSELEHVDPLNTRRCSICLS